jgi:hypothetical protein
MQLVSMKRVPCKPTSTRITLLQRNRHHGSSTSYRKQHISLVGFSILRCTRLHDTRAIVHLLNSGPAISRRATPPLALQGRFSQTHLTATDLQMEANTLRTYIRRDVFSQQKLLKAIQRAIVPAHRLGLASWKQALREV